MEDLPLGKISALVPEFAVKDLPLGKTLIMRTIQSTKLITFLWSEMQSIIEVMCLAHA